MDAEKLIISKQYIELTPSELKMVSELVADEKEFDDMKSFLLATQSVFKTQKIKSTPELDEKIMAHLHAAPTPNRVWYKSLMLFLFPGDTQFYKYPAFQLAIASLLVFGVFNIVNFDSLKGESLAYEDVSKAEEIFKEEKPAMVLTDEEYLLEEEPILNQEISTIEETPKEELNNETELSSYTNQVPQFESEVEEEKSVVVLDEQVDEAPFDDLTIVSTLDTKFSEDVDKVVVESDNMSRSDNYAETVDSDMEEEVKEINYAYSNSNGSAKDNSRKKKDKALKSGSAKSTPPVVSSVSQTQSFDLDDSTAQLIIINIESSPELKQLFFEVK